VYLHCLVHYKCASVTSKYKLFLLTFRCIFVLQMQGTITVEGLVFKLPRTGRVCFTAESFMEMKRLKLLQLDCVDLVGDYGCLSKQMRWVNWQGFTLNYIPNDFYQGNLVAIDLKHSKIKQIWNEAMV